MSNAHCRRSDPEPVKRLKREMEVALSEEDYATAGTAPLLLPFILQQGFSIFVPL